jgi:hypothetical protein
MNSSVGPLSWVVLLCLVPMIGFSQEEEPGVEVPRGYEEAATADAVTPVMEVVVEEQPGSLLEVLTDALDVGVDPNVLNLEQQYLPHFQPLLRAELSFLRRVCQLTTAQRKEIGEAGDRWLKTAVRKYAIAQNDMRHGGARFVGGVPAMPDPSKLIQQQFVAHAKQKLRPEQAKRYLEELDKRKAYRKRVAVRSLVARLDEELVLSAKQREELIESLSSNWQEAWGQSLEKWMHNIQVMPAINDRHVVPFLNKTQRTVWNGTPKQNVANMGAFGIGHAMVVVDDFDEIEDPSEE